MGDVVVITLSPKMKSNLWFAGFIGMLILMFLWGRVNPPQTGDNLIIFIGMFAVGYLCMFMSLMELV
jgi:hypothetical protein